MEETGIARDASSSSLIFLGTGSSTGIPNATCVIQPSDPPCFVCSQSLNFPPQFNPNYRCNTSLLIDYCQANGEHNYILIDAGKNFREQVLRWFTFHKIPRVDSVLLTHEHADAVLGLDDIHCVRQFSQNNDVSPIPIYATQECLDSVILRFPHLSNTMQQQHEVKGNMALVDWRIIENHCEKPFIASGLQINPLPVMHVISKGKGGQLDLLILDTNCIYLNGLRNTHFCFPETLDAVKRISPKRALLIGMNHNYDHDKVNQYLVEWSVREGISIQLARDGVRIPIEL